MAINKVEFGNQTLIDLTGDTATPEDVLGGKTFHTKSGEASVGTAGPYAGSDTNGGAATTAKKLFGQDTRSVNSPPSFYLASGQNSTLVTEFKNRAVIDAPGSSNFGTLITVTPWMDSSGGLPVQTYVDNTGQKAIRFAQTSETWGSWSTLASNSDIPSVGNGTIKLQRNGVDIMTFTTNQNSNVTGNLIIPTKVSELTNDSEFISDDDPRLTDSRNAKDVYAWAKASTKPSYTASEVGAIATSAKGANGGVAELDSAGKVPSSQLPSFVDDVLEYNSLSNFPTTGETGKIYIAKDTNKTYRWSGTTYVEISASLALGETSSTAYRGDRGKTAYDHSQVTSGNPHNVTKSDVGLGNVPNVTTDNQTPTVTEASTRANIATGDTLKTIIGKIKKFFTDLKTVAFTGSYNDLTNKPTIPAAQVNSDWNATSGVAQILNKPTIPTVNNATLTIQKNGTNVQTFTANQSTNATANITVPTKVSELTNDSGYTTNTGTVTSVAAGTGLSGGTITSSGTISLANHSADYLSGGYLNIHPENSPTLIPFMNNDIAYLLKRGGSAIVKYDGTTQSVDLTNCFDASPSYWAINPTNTTTIVIELTLHKAFTWTNTIYVDFGAAGWRAKNVKIEVMNSNYAQDVWTQKYSNTNNGLGHCYVVTSHTPVGASNAGGGFNKVRFTFSSWNNATIFRIAQMGIYNYGSAGLRETFLPKDGGNVYGTIYPNSNNGANLGTTSNYWNNAYITNINGVAVGSSPKFTDTTYTAGTGLRLSGTTFLTDVKRLNGGDLNYKPGVNRFELQEVNANTGNIPSNQWYHVLTSEGSDSNYEVQLALSMTGVPAAYYRRLNENVYSEWYRLSKALLQKHETGTITNNTWYRLFAIKYTQYNYLHLRVLVKAGYLNFYEAFICVRYTPSGMNGNATSIKVISTYNELTNADSKSLVLYKIDDNTIALAAKAYGQSSTLGFEILDITSEADAIKPASVIVNDSFVALSEEPTKFGVHHYLTGSYDDLVNKPTITTYNFSGTTFYSGNKDNAEHNANNAIKNGNYYYTSNGPATSLGASTADGALYVQSYNDTWVGQIAQDYRNGGLYVRGKNNGSWQSWYKIWDSRNLTNLNQLTNGPGYITGITKSMVTTALGYTPPTSDTNNAVTQTATTTSADYEVLFSATADNTTRTEGARKNSNLKFNPSTGNLTVASVNGETIKYTSSVNAVVGDTTCTISDSSITTTSLIEPFSSNSTGDTIAIKNIAVTAGQAVLTFKALTVDTSFRLRITNV